MKPVLSNQELKDLARVIGEVEQDTTGELRLILVERSSRASHTFSFLFLLLLTLVLCGAWILRHSIILSGFGSFLMPLACVVAGLSAFGLSRWSFLQRRLAWPADVDHQVRMRAELEFHREGLAKTSERTGILIFLSLFERQAVVLADEGIAARMPSSTWNDVVLMVVEGVRKGHLKDNLERAIRHCGSLLKKEFPAQPGDRNELPNRVLVKLD